MKKLLLFFGLSTALALSGKAIAGTNTESIKPKNNETTEGQEISKPKAKTSYSFTLFNFFSSASNSTSQSDTSATGKTAVKPEEKITK